MEHKKVPPEARRYEQVDQVVKKRKLTGSRSAAGFKSIGFGKTCWTVLLGHGFKKKAARLSINFLPQNYAIAEAATRAILLFLRSRVFTAGYVRLRKKGQGIVPFY